MGTGEVISATYFPMDVLTEDGNPTGEQVKVKAKAAYPSGDTLYEDEEGNLYVSKQSIQRAGAILVVSDEAPDGEEATIPGSEEETEGEEAETPENPNPGETGEFEGVS